jgi:hypothetical protein
VSGTDLYAGGSFTTAGGVAANHIAKWNGSTWSALGSGLDGRVAELAVSGTDLYAGGEFTSAGGSAANCIAKWDGSAWSALGSGMSGALYLTGVYALAVSGTNLYAGGNFTTAGGVAAKYIAKWDGSAWSALGSGLAGQEWQAGVYALAVSGTDLYAGGVFTSAGGTAANYIAKWNGSAWSRLGSGMGGGGGSPYVSALAVCGTDLYAGGYFTTAGGTAASHIAKWNGSGWSALGSGTGGRDYPYVFALAVSGTDLYAGGEFTSTGGTAANYIAKWNGSAWSALASGMSGDVFALAVSGTDLFVGGEFTIAGNQASGYVAKANFGAAGGRCGSLAYSPVTGFGFTFSDATAGQPYRIQTSPSLALGSWTDFTNFMYTTPIVIYDTSAVAAPKMLYRAVTP